MSGLGQRAKAPTLFAAAQFKKGSQPTMRLAEWITDTLNATLRPTRLIVTDESEQHRGHGGWREGGETHFRIDIVSEAFIGKSRLARHRLVNEAVKGAFERGLHALAIAAKAPGE
jgi:BolA protein